MKAENFDIFFQHLKLGNPNAICGEHFTKEQYDQVYDELKKQMKELDTLIFETTAQKLRLLSWKEHILYTHVMKKEDRRTD